MEKDEFIENENLVVREKCYVCGNQTFYNNVVLKTGHHGRVFVECAKCGALVARYILHAYIDPEYNYGSTLKQIRVSSFYGDSMSNLLEELQPHQDRAKTQFAEIIKLRKDREEQKIQAKDTEERIMELIYKLHVKEDG